MKKLTVGILAHVDAGKTTLSEGMLYLSGAIRKIGRVDHKDAFLDTYELEKTRGITIFSKQAMINLPTVSITLLDTPGHVDFCAEMERTLSVLDYAILVISGADGVQGHTKTLWRLLEKYNIPVFLFVNKMDQPGTDKEELLAQLKQNLDSNCVDFLEKNKEDFFENIAMCEENLLDEFLGTGKIEEGKIKEKIKTRHIFPCFFGSALKLTGVKEFLSYLEKYTLLSTYANEFGARVFKIARDEAGNRLTYLKITGGTLKARDLLSNKDNVADEEKIWEEKVNQIRIYSGNKFESVKEVSAGEVCALTGLTKTYPGEGLGKEVRELFPILEPVLTYQIILPKSVLPAMILPKLHLLEEEDPTLHLIWNEEFQEILVQIMGEVQIEVLKTLIKERFDVEVEFGSGSIVYKETIANTVEGVGHFEPLRHYAEVHLLMEPLAHGSGLVVSANCSEDILEKNWQRLILTHLKEKQHRGVLTGSAITDMKITLVSGRAHLKHTEGGDFRQATYRAVRQGLFEAQSVLLEPYYHFFLRLPEQMLGKAMNDLEQMNGSFNSPELKDSMAVLQGSVPVACMRGYQREFIAYTKGKGEISVELDGYYPCHNSQEIIEEIAYEAEFDTQNPAGSVFCTHGSGFYIDWNEVKNYMHLPPYLSIKRKPEREENIVSSSYQEEWMDTSEIDQIIARTFYANKRNKSEISTHAATKKVIASTSTDNCSLKPRIQKKEYFLVDGYNVIFAWKELNELAQVNINGARDRLMDILCDYQGMKKCHLIVVFDAYRVTGHQTELFDYHNIHVVYTKEAETADQYIEKFAHEKGRNYRVTVVTSDGLEQIIIRGQGCILLSSREFEQEYKETKENLRLTHMDNQPKNKTYLLDSLSKESAKELQKLKKQED